MSHKQTLAERSQHASVKEAHCILLFNKRPLLLSFSNQEMVGQLKIQYCHSTLLQKRLKDICVSNQVLPHSAQVLCSDITFMNLSSRSSEQVPSKNFLKINLGYF